MLTKHERRRILDLAAKGLTSHEIAEKVQHARPTVNRILSQRGYTRQKLINWRLEHEPELGRLRQRLKEYEQRCGTLESLRESEAALDTSRRYRVPDEDVDGLYTEAD